MYLLDTNVISELRKPRPHGGVLAWLDSVRNRELFLPAIVVGELQMGIERVRPHDAVKADQFEIWLGEILETFAIIPMDGDTCRIWAKLMVNQQEHLSEDMMIAATAIQHDYSVVTRNARDFESSKVLLINPFDYRET